MDITDLKLAKLIELRDYCRSAKSSKADAWLSPVSNEKLDRLIDDSEGADGR